MFSDYLFPTQQRNWLAVLDEKRQIMVGKGQQSEFFFFFFLDFEFVFLRGRYDAIGFFHVSSMHGSNEQDLSAALADDDAL